MRCVFDKEEGTMAMTCRFLLIDMRAGVALAALTVASCTSSSSLELLQQVRASNPSVTYEYAGDEELLQAQQNAVVFCNQYQAAPRPARITTGSNGRQQHRHLRVRSEPADDSAA